MHNNYIYLISIISLIFAIFIYKILVKNPKVNNENIRYKNLENSTTGILKKISSKPFLLGLEKNFVSKDEFYFDEKNFYAINKEKQKASFKLTDIIELKRTSNKMNNRYVWEVSIQEENNKELSFLFTNNYTIRNKDFHLFYKKIESINPNAVKSKWSLLSL